MFVLSVSHKQKKPGDSHFKSFGCHKSEEASQTLLDFDLDITVPNVSDEHTALPSEPREHAALPSVPTGIDPIYDCSTVQVQYSCGLRFMQWVAYGNANDLQSPPLGLQYSTSTVMTWPSGLVAFCGQWHDSGIWLKYSKRSDTCAG